MGFAIGVECPKREVNIGTLWRSAYCLGASMVFTVGLRYKPQGSDTVKAWRHIPLFNFKSWDEFQSPYDWVPIGIEIDPESTPLAKFYHPKQAVYILGAEDHGLTQRARQICQSRLVSIPSRFCLNVAVAGSIVMYDRQVKHP